MKLTHFSKLPPEVYLAFSGGIDSCVLLHNLIKRKIGVTLIYIDHKDQCSIKERPFAISTAKQYGIELDIYEIPEFDKTTSLECFWSRARDEIYQSLDRPVLTGHHLDDAIEWYVMSTFQGTPKLLNYSNKNVLRPMLGIRKETINKYLDFFKLDCLFDETNLDTSFNLRNKVRIKLLPGVEEIFPGIAKTVLRLIKDKESKSDEENKI